MNYHICILLRSQKQANNCHKGESHLLTVEITLRQKTDLCDLTVETQGFYDGLVLCLTVYLNPKINANTIWFTSSLTLSFQCVSVIMW